MKTNVSLGARLIETMIRLSRMSGHTKNESDALKYLDLKRQQKPVEVKVPRLKSTVNETWVLDCPVYHLKQAHTQDQNLIIYLHGGAYVSDPVSLHWRFIDRLVSETNMQLCFPLYPKAPKYHVEDAFAFMKALYQEINHTQYDNIILMGDSAGAGLALAFSEWILKQKMRPIQKMVLISPWLDLSMSNPDMKAIEAQDVMLGIEGLKTVAQVWAQDIPLDDPRLSPINGITLDCPNTLVFVGTHEIFYPDVMKLKTMTDAMNLAFAYHVFEGLFHVFPLIPIKEGQAAFRIICDFLNVDTSS